MSRITRVEVVDFPSASESDRARALESAAALVASAFDGPGLAGFCAGLRAGAFHFYQMGLYYDQAELVGFSAYTLDPMEGEEQGLAARAITVLRPAWRGARRTALFWIRTMSTLLWRHRGVPLWIFTPAQHVASYRFLAKHLRGMVPHPDRAPTDEEIARVARLAAQFHYTRLPTDHPLSCRRTIWLRAAQRTPPPGGRPRDAFDETFEALNPANHEGGCVLTLGRLTLLSILGTLAQVPLHLARDWLRRQLPAQANDLAARATRS